jgi:hypothetical protein
VCSNILNKSEIDAVKGAVGRLQGYDPSNHLTSAFHKWQVSDTEVALLTDYAVDDFQNIKEIEVVFACDDSGNCTWWNVEVKHLILNWYAVVDQISHGHKHVIILDFRGIVPQKIKTLPKIKDVQSTPSSLVGLCRQEDLSHIIENRSK